MHRLIPPVYQGIFYADIASDIKQLLLFYQKDLWDYCLFNFLGLLIPPIVSIREALRWRERLSPDQNFFKGLIHSDVMQKLVILTAILTQTYMLILAMVSIRFRKTPGARVLCIWTAVECPKSLTLLRFKGCSRGELFQSFLRCQAFPRKHPLMESAKHAEAGGLIGSSRHRTIHLLACRDTE